MATESPGQKKGRFCGLKNYCLLREEGRTASPSLYRGPDTTVCAASGKAALSDRRLGVRAPARSKTAQAQNNPRLENLISSLFTPHGLLQTLCTA